MITIFESLYSSSGVFVPTTARALFDALSRPKDFADKAAPKRWLAWRTRDGGRKTVDLVECHAVVVDVDDSPVPLSTLADALGEIWCFVYSTWSATEDAPRWRIVVPLERPISLPEFRRVQRAVMERVERVATVDASAKDASHVWSAPAKQPGGWFACQEVDGAVFDIPAALERFPEEQPLPPAPPPKVRFGSRYARAALRDAATAIASSPRGERNHVVNAQTYPIGRFVQTGKLNEDEVIRVLSEAAIAAGLPAREARYTVRRALHERLRRVG